jgi:hypothetical protein
MMKSKSVSMVLSVLLCMGAAKTATASLLAYDGFSYAVGDLDGGSNNGGYGWSGAWTRNGVYPE